MKLASIQTLIKSQTPGQPTFLLHLRNMFHAVIECHRKYLGINITTFVHATSIRRIHKIESNDLINGKVQRHAAIKALQPFLSETFFNPLRVEFILLIGIP